MLTGLTISTHRGSRTYPTGAFSPFQSPCGLISNQTPCYPHTLPQWDHSESMTDAKDKYRVWIFPRSQCVEKSGTCLFLNSQFRAKRHNCGSALPEIAGATWTPALSFTACVNVLHFQKSMLPPPPNTGSSSLVKSTETFHFTRDWGHSERLSRE